jgi:hypothetical protein
MNAVWPSVLACLAPILPLRCRSLAGVFGLPRIKDYLEQQRFPIGRKACFTSRYVLVLKSYKLMACGGTMPASILPPRSLVA